jgi:hypothetical protein
MTLYNCPDCRRWHNGTGHICTDPLPEIRDTNSLKSAVVRAARDLIRQMPEPGEVGEMDLGPLAHAIAELDGHDRPLGDV